jgi:2-polyprenyl-3-methyl-5-hydroxy-6-metoxy-1,4-benzoquinol methylase
VDVPTFDERAGWFDEHYATTRGKVRRTLVLERIRATAPPPPAAVLDVGGGSGAIAIPLAADGYRVTVADPSRGMLDVATANAAEAGVGIRLEQTGIDDLAASALGTFDVVCCHAVLLYVDDPLSALRTLRSVAREGATLSLLEKNRGALAIRPGLAGDYAEALRVLDDPVATGNLGIANLSHSVATWLAWLDEAGWDVSSWAGIRLFSDTARDDLSEPAFRALVDLEREAGTREPYRSVARLVHFAATAR